MIEALKHFIAFAERGSKALEIPHEQFIVYVTKLERLFQHKLVRQIGDSRILLTDFGRQSIPNIKQAFIAISKIMNLDDKQSMYDLDNHVTIGLVHDSASTWAMNCIKGFNKAHPGLRLILFAANRMTDAMLEKSDIIFWSVQEVPYGYNALWYIEFKYGLYASDTYIARRGTPTLETIPDHSIIAYSGEDNNAKASNWHLYGEYGLPFLRPTILSQSRDLIVKMTADGFGIGAISDRQDAYYKYSSSLMRVIPVISGPVLKSYFLIRCCMNEPSRVNVRLLEQLFKVYFKTMNIKVIDV
ncbi:MAG: LysR family transcriptional regulator [Holosporales bacterium]|jgi:DNA-binding transcriptional LysR family regulator|nr:LysR family transcriptional regulator [Holosporales bacterium]